MESVKVESIQENTRFPADISIDDTFLVCAAGLPVLPSVLAALNEWDFAEVWLAEQPSEGAEAGKTEASGAAPGAAHAAQPGPDSGGSSARTEKAPGEKPVTAVKFEALQEALTQVSGFRESAQKEDAQFAAVKSVYEKFVEYIDALYSYYAEHEELELTGITEAAQSLCGFVTDAKRFILRIRPADLPLGKNYLANHAMRSAVIAILIGAQMTMPQSRLTELSIACILHEIGMIRLPPQLYLTTEKLSPKERSQLSIHPLLGYNMLKAYGFPQPVVQGVLEHHEKEDGTGYPRRIDGQKISLFAKIIAVACSYEAITSPRTYKSEESAHAAMVDLLKNTGKQYAQTVVRALLYSLSLYPIGTYVLLSNGQPGMITDVNPKDPKNSIVQLLNEKNADGSPKIIETGSLLRVSSILTPEEAEKRKARAAAP